MAASLIQTSAVAVATGEPGVDPLVMTLSGVTAGNSILVMAVQVGAIVRTLSVSDNVDGSYDEAVSNNPSRGTYIFYLHDVTGGNVTITAELASGAGAMEAKAFEVSGLDPLAAPIVASYRDGGSVNTHYCAPSGSIDTSGPTFVLAGGVTVSGSGITSISPDGTYTQSASNYATRTLYQHKVAASALTDDRGAWSHAGTAREGISAMVAFPEASGGGDTTLGADLAATSTTTADLATAIALAAAPQASATLGATLATELSLAASLSASSTCTGALGTEISASAALAAAATLTPTLTTAFTLASALTTTSTVTAALDTSVSLASALSASATLAADLATDSTLASAMSATSTLTAALATELSLAAALTCATNLAADLDTAVTLAAAWSSTTTLTADLTAGAGLASSLTSTTTLSGALATQVTAAADWSAASTLSASLTTAIHLSAGWEVAAVLMGDLAAVSLSQPVNIAAVLASGRAARTPGRAGVIVPGRTGAQVPRGE